MKIWMICVASIFLFQSVVFPTIVKADLNLIDKTCKQTPYYNLCISSLKSDPRSSTADVTGLALIMVDVVKTKSTTTQNQIARFLQGSRDPRVQTALKSCGGKYNAIINGDIPEAIQALKTGNPKFAEQGMNDAGNEANSCESGFGGKSPLTDSNQFVHDASAVAAAIVRNLL